MKKNILILSLILFVTFSVTKPSESVLHKFNPHKSFEYYKKTYLSKDGRIIDPIKNYATTSESQAYMLFMCYAQNDRKTFDLVYNWTKNNLGRKDGLYSWIWGKDKNGKYKILDNNSASDADEHMARASILAYEKWKDKKYLKDGQRTINSIWNKEVKKIGKYWVLMPGPAQKLSLKIEINPSYFAPYSYKVFKKYDPRHDWEKVVDSSYYYLNQVMSKTKTGLPPNWFLIKNGEIVLENSERSDFSYDAVRVFWRIYSDYQKTGEPRALLILEKSKFFITEWKNLNNVYINYQINGELRNLDKFVGSIAILLPAINMYDKKVASEIYRKEILPYVGKDGYWPNKNQYYAKNLLWFGGYMYLNRKALR